MGRLLYFYHKGYEYYNNKKYNSHYVFLHNNHPLSECGITADEIAVKKSYLSMSDCSDLFIIYQMGYFVKLYQNAAENTSSISACVFFIAHLARSCCQYFFCSLSIFEKSPQRANALCHNIVFSLLNNNFINCIPS